MASSHQRSLPLSNHAVVSLGILTRKAKKDIGVYKTSEIIENSAQAYELFTRVIIFGDDELHALALELNKTLKITPNLMGALAEYVQHIRADETNPELLKSLLEALSLFTQDLYEIEFDSLAYRDAADAFLLKVANYNHDLSLKLIRSFYPYWQSTHNALINANDEKNSSQEDRKALIHLWNELDNQSLSESEEVKLTAYKDEIASLSLNEKEITLRLRIAKLIIIQQRNFIKSPTGYRMNMNMIVASLTNDDLLTYFLSVSREFFPIWKTIQENQETLA